MRRRGAHADSVNNIREKPNLGVSLFILLLNLLKGELLKLALNEPLLGGRG
jgi:hypothetical protein